MVCGVQRIEPGPESEAPDGSSKPRQAPQLRQVSRPTRTTGYAGPRRAGSARHVAMSCRLRLLCPTTFTCHGHVGLLGGERGDGERRERVPFCSDAVEEHGQISTVDLRSYGPRRVHDGGQRDLDEDQIGLIEVRPNDPLSRCAIDKRRQQRGDAIAGFAHSSEYAEPTIEEYAERTTETVNNWKSMNGKQGGDPAKLAAALVKLASQDEPPVCSSRGVSRGLVGTRT